MMDHTIIWSLIVGTAVTATIYLFSQRQTAGEAGLEVTQVRGEALQYT
jgi:predicted membrane channel-forming protein YqfA (hemolysin III family)